MISPPRQARQRFLTSVQAELYAAQAEEESPLVSKRAAQPPVRAPRAIAGTRRVKRVEGDEKEGKVQQIKTETVPNPFVDEGPVSPLVAGYRNKGV